MSMTPNAQDVAEPGAGAASGEAGSLGTRLAGWRDRLDVRRRDGARRLRDQTAIAASTGRAQVERVQDFLAYHAEKRPLLVTGLAATAGVLAGVLLQAGARRRRK